MKRGDSVNDGNIIDLFFERNEQAIKETEKKYGKLIFGISKNILGNREDAEECTNDTYLGLWNAIPPSKPMSLMAFAAKIARNLSLKRLEYNKAEKRSAYELVSLSELEEFIPDEQIKDGISEEELGQIISDFLMTEKEDARNVFMRKYWFFDSIEAISERYSFSESKVKSMLFQTRNRLKKHLKDRGIHV